MPQSSVCVTGAQQNSGVVVRPCTTAPELKMRSTMGWVTAETLPRSSNEPSSESRPAIGCSSFSMSGMPSRGRAVPSLNRCSDSRAAAYASSSICSVTAPISGSVRSVRATTASSSSTGESSRRLSSPVASVAVMYSRSTMILSLREQRLCCSSQLSYNVPYDVLRELVLGTLEPWKRWFAQHHAGRGGRSTALRSQPPHSSSSKHEVSKS